MIYPRVAFLSFIKTLSRRLPDNFSSDRLINPMGLKPTVLIYRCLMRHIIRSPDRFFPNVRQNIFIAPSPALCANHRTSTSSWRHMQPVILVQKAKESSSCVFVWIQTAAQQNSRRPIINSVCRTEFVWKVRGRSVPSPCKSSNVSELVVWQKGVSL